MLRRLPFAGAPCAAACARRACHHGVRVHRRRARAPWAPVVGTARAGFCCSRRCVAGFTACAAAPWARCQLALRTRAAAVSCAAPWLVVHVYTCLCHGERYTTLQLQLGTVSALCSCSRGSGTRARARVAFRNSAAARARRRIDRARAYIDPDRAIARDGMRVGRQLLTQIRIFPIARARDRASTSSSIHARARGNYNSSIVHVHVTSRSRSRLSEISESGSGVHRYHGHGAMETSLDSRPSA